MTFELVPHSACPVCGCLEYWVLASVQQLEHEKEFRDQLFKRRLPAVPESMLDDLTVFTNSYPARLVVCRACGLVCRDPRFSPQAAIQAYSSDDYSDEWLESTFSEYHASYSSRMPQLRRVVGEKAHVLEVGSYVGGFLAAAREHGWSALGVDVGYRVSRFCRDKGLDVIRGTLREAKLATASFDAVFVWVCFDQLADPQEELSEIRRVLKPGGWLYVHVPNGDFIKVLERIAHGALTTPACKALAYTGMAGFPYQIGYTGKVLLSLFTQSGYENVAIENRMDVCDESTPVGRRVREQTRYLRQVQRLSELTARLSGNRLLKGPWLLATCQRA